MQRAKLTPIVMGALLVLAGCVGGLGGTSTTPAPSDDGGERTGSVSFYISDEKNAIGDFEHLNVTVTKIGFKKVESDDESTNATTTNTTTTNTTTSANTTTTNTTSNATTTATTTTVEEDEADDEETESDDGEWVTRDVDNVTIDLTEYQGANATRIANVSVPNGTYEKVFVYVSEVNGTLESGEQVNVKLPSSKLHVNKEFTVGDGEDVDYVFDITVFEAGKSGKYILKPVVSQSGTDVPIEEKHERDDDDSEAEESDDDSDDEETAELEAELAGNVTVGENVTLTLTRNDTAVQNATVTVNGESAGTTDADGTLTFTVPDAKRLKVTATADGAKATITERLAGGSGDEQGGQDG